MNLTDIQESATLKFSEAANELKKQGKSIISLGLGEPSFQTPSEIVNETIAALKAGHTRYSSTAGIPELRELIAEKLRTENTMQCTAQNIVITPGAKQAIFLALRAILNPEDEIINITPCYVSNIPQIKIAQPSAKIINIDLDKNTHKLDITKIKQSITPKTKAILINSPHNPTGKVFTKEELSNLAKLAKEHNIFIISDEIYEKLIFDSQNPHYSIASFDGMAERTITINGFSKTYSMTGWRLGYCCAPEKIAKIMTLISQHINTNVCTFIQKGACAIKNIPDVYLKNFITQIKTNAQLLNATIKETKNLSLVSPNGSFFGFINISKTNMESDKFCSKLLIDKGVAITPGISFGSNWDDHIRVSLSASTKDFEEGMKRLKEWSEELE